MIHPCSRSGGWEPSPIRCLSHSLPPEQVISDHTDRPRRVNDNQIVCRIALRRPRHRAPTSVSGQKLSAGRGSEQVIFGRLLLRQSDQAVRRPQRNLRRIGRGRRLWPCAPEWLFPESVPVRGGVATTLLISKQGWQCRAVALSALLASSDEPFLRTAPSGRASGGIRGGGKGWGGRRLATVHATPC